MSDRWYVTHEGQTLGPLPTNRLLELLQSGRFTPGELVWPEGVDVQITVQRFLEMDRRGESRSWLASVLGSLARPETWHVGQPEGHHPPLSRQALQALAERGELQPTDILWQESSAGWYGTEARSVVAFPPSTAPVLPSWLSDVSQMEEIRKPAPAAVPEWMDDVRQSEQLSAAPPKAPPPSITIPRDWMDDIRHIEESLRRPPAAPAKTAPPPPKPPPAAAPTVPAAKTTVKPPAPVTTIRPAAHPTVAPAAPPPKTPPAPDRGFDPETGQIHDPAAYRRWQKEEQQRRQAELQKEPGLCVFELFLNARRDLERWVDDDANKSLVLSGNAETLWRSAALQERLRPYQGYGSVMLDKLHKHFALLVENRRKFHAAFSGR